MRPTWAVALALLAGLAASGRADDFALSSTGADSQQPSAVSYHEGY